MYKLTFPDGKTTLTEKPVFVRRYESGVYLITDMNRAEGVNYNGENYRFDEGAMCHEIDAAKLLESLTDTVDVLVMDSLMAQGGAGHV